jgi:hypothetical protein
VAEDPTNPFAEILGDLKSDRGRQSTSKSKGVRPDAKPGEVKPDLVQSEIARYKKIFNILKDIMNPGPEAKTIETTKAASIGKLGDMQKSEVPATAKPKEQSWLKVLLLALGAAAAAWLSQFIDGVTEWGIKTLLKVKPLFKPLVEIITLVKMKFWKFIKGFKPVLGLIDKITSFFGGFSKAVKAAPVLGKIMTVGGSIMKVIKTAGMAAGKVLMKFGRFLPWIGSIFSFGFAIEKYLKGDLVGGTLELVSGIINLLPGGVFVSALLDGYILYRDMTSGKDTESGVNPESGEPGMLSKIWTSITDWFSANFTKLPIIAGIVKMGEAVGHLTKGEWLPGFRALYQIIPSLIGGSVGGDLIGKGFDFVMNLFASAGSVNYDSVTTAAGDAWGWVKDIFSDIGEVFSGLFTAISDWVSEAVKGGLKYIKQKASKIPGLGWLADDTPEEVAAAKVGKSMASKSQWSNGYPSMVKRANDGMISKNGILTAYDDQDDLLAARSGGPIDKMLDGNSAVMSELNNVSKNQLNVLISIRDGINMLVSKSGGNNSTAIQFKPNPLTQEFYA